MRERERQLVWSEEEMRYLDPPPPARRSNLATPLRRVLAQVPAERPHEQTRSSIIFTPNGVQHGNFIDASYRRILANPEWARRLLKAHTAKRQARPVGPEEERRNWHELDAATSSDALLMNIFCYPRVLAGGGLARLLGVEAGCVPEFGFKPRVLLKGGLRDRTEIDLRLGTLLIEAKLTESGFQTAALRLLERYGNCYEVFDPGALEIEQGKVAQYQLLRGILAADALDGEFCLLVDARRKDLIDCWAATVGAVRSCELRTRLNLVTWQEIAAVVPRALRLFLAAKYDLRG